MIKTVGYDSARGCINERSWRRHIKLLREIGLSDADLQSGEVVSLRRRELVIARPVRSWAELRLTA